MPVNRGEGPFYCLCDSLQVLIYTRRKICPDRVGPVAPREGCQGRCFHAPVCMLSPGVSAVPVTKPLGRQRARPNSAHALLSSAASSLAGGCALETGDQTGLAGKVAPRGLGCGLTASPRIVPLEDAEIDLTSCLAELSPSLCRSVHRRIWSRPPPPCL